MSRVDLAGYRKRCNIREPFDALQEANKRLERWGGRTGFQPANPLCWVIFTELLRMKQPIDEALEKLLPVPEKPEHVEEAKLCLAAIPEARQRSALFASLQRADNALAVDGGLAWLTVYPEAELVELVLARSKHSELMPPTKARAALAKLEHPAIAALAGRPAPRLTTSAVTQPRSPADLTALQTKQLLAAAKAYDGKSVAIELRFAGGGEASFGSTIALRTVTVGKRAFDVVEFAGDAGSVFASGTTREVAAIVQGGIECEDAALHAELAEALASKPIASSRADGRSGKAKPKAKTTTKRAPKREPKLKPTKPRA